MKKNAIVSFANSVNAYIQKLGRLADSLRNNFDGEFIGYINEESVGAPLHKDDPYAFKIYCINKVREAGYEKILWLDTSCFAIKNVQPVFDDIEKNGMVFQDGGHWIGHWANDFTLDYFKMTRDEAMELKTIGNAGFLGFDFSNPIAVDFFKRWEDAMLAGCFKGAWTNADNSESDDERCRGHRHDLSSSSIIVHQMGLAHLMKGGEELLQYAGLYDETLNDSIIIKAQG